eukprot:4508955-Amphidinium_carterae.1
MTWPGEPAHETETFMKRSAPPMGVASEVMHAAQEAKRPDASRLVNQHMAARLAEMSEQDAALFLSCAQFGKSLGPPEPPPKIDDPKNR